MATFSLTDLRNEVSKKYAPTVIENGDDTYTLLNLLQMPTKKRDKVMELVDQIESEEKAAELPIGEQVKIFEDILVAAEQNDRGKELLELLGDNTAMLFELIQRWMEGTQLGEAEQS